MTMKEHVTKHKVVEVPTGEAIERSFAARHLRREIVYIRQDAARLLARLTALEETLAVFLREDRSDDASTTGDDYADLAAWKNRR